MNKFDELYDLVLESSEKEDHKKFNTEKKMIKDYVKNLKKAIRNNDTKSCKYYIDKIEKELDNLRDLCDNLKPEDYKGHGWVSIVNFARFIIMYLIYELFDLDHRLYYIDKKTPTQKMMEFREEIIGHIGTVKRSLEKLKKKCDRKGINISEIDLSEIYTTESAGFSLDNDTDSLRLKIFESCYSGDITEDEMESLLNQL